MNTYSELMAKKRPWQVTKGVASPVVPGSENTIGRALALRILEIPVGEWVGEGCKRELSKLSSDAVELLESNIRDEYKHEEVLNHATSVYDLTTSQMQTEAQELANRWISHPDHPIVKAGVLESSIFFVILPIFRFLGGTALRTNANDISNDEVVHARTNRMIAEELGYSWSPSINKLREETVRWIVDDLDAPGKWGYPDVWIDSSESLLLRGAAPQLKDTQAYVASAFFEINNANLPVYY